jgi:hypothetical protein
MIAGPSGRANDSSSAVGMFGRVSDGWVVARRMVFGFIFSATAHRRLTGSLRAAMETVQQAPDRGRVVDLASVGDPHDGDRDADIRDLAENAVLPDGDAPDPLLTRA